jgi:AcrR family transcriptional regulator
MSKEMTDQIVASTACEILERGEIARKKLIEAGLKIYSAVGYEKASTRLLAAEAGVNIAAIPYYFGSKEGLYLAVIDSIIDYYRAGLGDSLTLIQTALGNTNTTDEEYRTLLDHYMRQMIHFILKGSPEREQISRIYTREQLDPTSAFDRLYTGFVKELHETIAALIARILQNKVSSSAAKIVAQTLLGQVTVFKSSRRAVLRNMDWEDYQEQGIAEIESILMFQVNAMMQAHLQKSASL